MWGGWGQENKDVCHIKYNNGMVISIDYQSLGAGGGVAGEHGNYALLGDREDQ